MPKRDEITGRMLSTHGMRYTPLYSVFKGMVERCCNSTSPHWKDYGGRGIFICAEWLNDRSRFFGWAIENGYREGLQIDREDNDGPYSPENCQWVTIRDNSRNRRSTKLNVDKVAEIRHLLAEGYSLAIIAAQYGICFQSVDDVKKRKSWPEVVAAATVAVYPATKQLVRRPCGR